MIIKSFFAFYYFLFVLGASIFLNVNSFKKIEIFFLSSIIYSLSLSWFFIFFINIFKIKFTFEILFFLFCVSMLLIYFNRQNKIKVNNNELIDFFLFFVLLFVIFFAILLSKYIPVFVHGDAVFQWNGRWAWLLYLNEFKPNGTYPVFWPGLWALIYKAESSFGNWIIPSMSQFILPILLILTLYLFYKKNKILFFYNFLFLVFFFWIFRKTALVGYMDTKIALLYLIFFQIFLLYLLSDNDENFLLLLSLIAGIASITKQVGFLLPFLSFVFLFFVFLEKKINFKLFFLFSIIPFIFLISFLSLDDALNPLIFFFDLIFSQNSINSNFSHLQSEAEKNHFASFNVILLSFNKIFLIIIFILSLLNFIKLKNKFCLYGSIIFLSGVVGFYFFSKYGSYDERNGRFIISILFSSSMFYLVSRNISQDGFNFLIIKKIANFKFNKIIFFSTFFLILISILFSKIINFHQIQYEIQSKLGTIGHKDSLKKEVPIIIKDLIVKLPDCSKVLIDEHILAYNYHLIKYYSLNKKKSKIQVYNYPQEFLQNTNYEKCKEPIVWYFKKENTFDNIKNDTNINNLKLEKINKYIYLVRKKN
mgnify:CR=1 FL=1